MRAWLLLAAALAWAASSVGAAWWGERSGRALCRAEHLQAEAAERAAGDQAASAAAATVVQRVVVHRRVIQEVQRDVASDPVQRECRSGDESLRVYNSAIPPEPGGDAASSAAGDVPASDAGDR